MKEKKAENKIDSIDLAKFIFAFSVIYIHAGEGTVTQPILSKVVDAFNSLAVPFFFITAGYFFFSHLEILDSVDMKRNYTEKYILKTIKIYAIWSIALIPSRVILSTDSMLLFLIKWLRVFLFIGDAQLWYLNALIVGLVLVLFLKKIGLNDRSIMLASIVLFLLGLCVQKQLDIMEPSAYSGILRIYYLIFGKTVKNGLFVGIFYCMIGKLISKSQCNMKRENIYVICLFIVYAMSIYKHFQWHSLLLPILSLLVFDSIRNTHIKLGEKSKWYRSMSTLMFLSHYIFVQMFVCFPKLTIYFPAGGHKYFFVVICTLLLSAALIFWGNKNIKVRKLWQ